MTATDLCDYRAFSGQPETQIKDLRVSNFFIIAAKDQSFINCRGDRRSLPPTPLTVVELACGCDLSSWSTYLSPVMSGCEPGKAISVGVMVNLVHLISFNMFPFDERAREFLTISDETVVADVPQLSEMADYEQRMAEDRSSGIGLAVAVKELSERTTILQGTVIHDLVDGVYVWSWQEIAVFIATALWLFLLTGSQVIGAYYLQLL